MTEARIREFRFESDYAGAVQLWAAVGEGVHVGASDAPAEVLKKLRHDPELFLVSEVDGVIVGTVIGGFDGRRGLVHHLAVSPAYQGQGIGSRLMNEVESRLRARGCIRCWLLVGTDNASAIDFYEKRGWRALPDIPYAKDLV
jgi:ribosomal protein S18 acetylase RimI-like enzyme